MAINGLYDSSGTDDDLPPSHQNRNPRGVRNGGNGRSPAAYPRMYGETDMEGQIRQLEREAYSSVLRAFKAQADAITWEKESLMTELRKELRLSNEEHRELLSRVDSEDVIRRIREWKQSTVHDSVPSQSLARPRRKVIMQKSVPGSSKMKYPPPGTCGRGRVGNQISESVEAASSVGRRVRTRWPDDNNFYEAIITTYDPKEGKHCLVYDMGAPNETCEWVKISEIPPEDIQWLDGVNRAPGGGRSRGFTKALPRNDRAPSRKGKGNNESANIKLLHTDTLIKEVERVLSGMDPDPVVFDNAKDMLKEHEQELVNAIARLGEISDGESDERDQEH